MTQEILYRCAEGIVMASDSRIVHIASDGQRQYLAAQKVFTLGKQALIGTAGAFVGVGISRRFAEYAQGARLQTLEEIVPPARQVFEQEYGRFIQENRDWFAAHPEAYRSLYLLLAGPSATDRVSPWQVRVLASEEHRLPFQELPAGEVLTIPRRLGVEGQLMMRLKNGSPLEDVAAFCYNVMLLLADRDPNVGGPFHVAILDHEGIRWWQPADEGSV